MLRPRLAGLTLAFGVSCCVTAAQADWPATPNQGIPVCVATGEQNAPEMLADGVGGAFFVWVDDRAGFTMPQLYAQHLSFAGDPLLATDGISLAPAKVASDAPAIVSDADGRGAIVVWRDFRADTAGNLYAQHLSASGEALWGATGVGLNTGPLHETQPVAIADGAGGVIVAWRDDRDGPSTLIRAQRLDASGALQWGADGIVLAPAPGAQTSPRIVPDAAPGAGGPGGAVIAWSDGRGPGENVYAQRISTGGSVLWAPAGVPLSTTTHGVGLTMLASDGRGGAYAALLDNRSQNSWQQAYAQHVDRSGATVWASDGVSLSGPAWPVEDVQTVGDGSGGTYLGWRDYENDGTNRVFAAHFDSAGTSLGSALVGGGFDGNGWFGFSMIPDEAGGAILGWNGLDGSVYSVFAQRVGGTVSALWSASGVKIAQSSYLNFRVRLVSDARGGALAGWMDLPTTFVSDLYATRVDRNGQQGTAGVPPAMPAGRLALAAGPSPLRAGTALEVRLTLPSAGVARVSVLDVLGRAIVTLAHGVLAAGETTWRWDGRDTAGRRVAPGLYLLCAETDGRSVSQRVVVTR